MELSPGLLTHTLDELPLEVALLNSDGQIIYTNRRWREFGIENAYVGDPASLGENYLEISRQAKDDEIAMSVVEGLEALLADERQEFSLEYPCDSPDEVRWFSMSAKRIEYGDETVIYVGHSDITQERLLKQEMEFKNKQLNMVASVISHDLRNPLNVASGFAEILEERHGESAPEIERIRNALTRMNTIITDALVLARDTKLGDTQTVDLETVAETAWSHVDTEEATLRVTGTLSFEAKSTILGNLFENIFRNAIEHVGPDVTVEVGPLGDSGFYIADDGTGIPEPIRRTLEEMELGAGETARLGLTIVKRIVTAHGWSLSITDDPDLGGARFEITGVK